MSFILDALKKVEEEKRVEHQSTGFIHQEGGRSFGEPRAQLLFTFGIAAIAFAALVLLGYVWLQYRSDGSERVKEDTTANNIRMDDPSVTSVGNAKADSRSTIAGASIELTEQESLVSQRPDKTTGPMVRDTLREESDGRVLDENPLESNGDLEWLKVAPAVRHLGQHSTTETPASKNYLREEKFNSGEVRENNIEGDLETALKGDLLSPGVLPRIVLQGTSVLDGAPVAVVNDLRVFEGDVIDGVRILRIMERAVELEFQGYRFTVEL